jgi:Uma2 family endonuclease
MSFAHPIRYSRAEYVAFETSSNVRHEFLDGQIYGMAGGIPEHAALAAAVIGLLFGQLRSSSCRPYDADLRVRVLETGLTTNPDVTVVCGPPLRDPEDENAVTNPTFGSGFRGEPSNAGTTGPPPLAARKTSSRACEGPDCGSERR